MSFGIPKKSMRLITNTLSKNKEVEKASIFGSRSMGNYKNGSDVDIAVYGKNITMETINRISVELNEKLPLPYYFDILHYDSLDLDSLKDHIDTFGKVFYKRNI